MFYTTLEIKDLTYCWIDLVYAFKNIYYNRLRPKRIPWALHCKGELYRFSSLVHTDTYPDIHFDHTIILS